MRSSEKTSRSPVMKKQGRVGKGEGAASMMEQNLREERCHPERYRVFQRPDRQPMQPEEKEKATASVLEAFLFLSNILLSHSVLCIA